MLCIQVAVQSSLIASLLRMGDFILRALRFDVSLSRARLWERVKCRRAQSRRVPQPVDAPPQAMLCASSSLKLTRLTSPRVRSSVLPIAVSALGLRCRTICPTPGQRPRLPDGRA